MKNKKFSIAFSCSVFCLLLASCSNFLSGSSLKEDLDKQINWANADKVSARISLDLSSYGTIYPSDITVLKGESFEIEFTKSEKAQFIDWVCLDGVTGKEIKDGVLFEKKEAKTLLNNDEENFVTVTLNTKQTSVIIKPVCYLKTESNSPVFDFLFIARNLEDISSLNPAEISANENLVFRYYAVDDKTLIQDNKEFSFYADSGNFLSEEEVASNIKKFHVSDTLYIFYQIHDDNSGLKSMSITQNLIRDQNNNEVSGETFSSEIIDYSSKSYSESICIQDTIKYTLSDSISDGVVQLMFDVKDNASDDGNGFSIAVDLIKDTEVEYKDLPSDEIEKYVGIDAVNNKITANTYKTVSMALADSSFSSDGKNLLYPYYFIFTGTSKPYVTDMNGNKYYDEDEWKISCVTLKTAEGDLEPYSDFETETDSNEYGKTITTSVFKLKKDPYDDLYVDVNLTDGAGNICTYEMILYKSLEIEECFYNEQKNNLTVVFNKAISNESIKPSIYFIYSETKIQTGEIEAALNERLETGTAGTFYFTSVSSSNLTRHNSLGCIDIDKMSVNGGSKLTINNLPDGYYYFFVKGAGKAYLSSPWEYRIGQTSSSLLTLNDVPDFTVKKTGSILNSKKHTLKIEYDSDFVFNDDYTYLIKYTDSDNDSQATVINYTAQTEFELLNTLSTYYFKCCVFDEKGNSICSNEYVSLDLSYDNIPPEINLTEDIVYYPNGLVLPQISFSDMGTGLKENAEDIDIEYIFTNTNYEENTGDIDWQNYSLGIYTQTYKNGDPLYFYRDGIYLKNLYFRVRDKNGNYTEKHLELILPDNSIEVSAEVVNSDLTVNYDDYSTEDKIFIQYFNDGKWKNIQNSFNNNGVTLTEEEKKSFLRIWIVKTDKISSFIYIYPQEKECNLCDATQGIRGLNIFIDQPCFVHTFCCSQKLWTQEDWYTEGIEIKAMYSDSSFTYTLTDTLDYYYYKYYVTIIHFADGTTVMTEPVLNN